MARLPTRRRWAFPLEAGKVSAPPKSQTELRHARSTEQRGIVRSVSSARASKVSTQDENCAPRQLWRPAKALGSTVDDGVRGYEVGGYRALRRRPHAYPEHNTSLAPGACRPITRVSMPGEAPPGDEKESRMVSWEPDGS